MSLFRVSLLSGSLLLAACSSPTADSVSSEAPAPAGTPAASTAPVDTAPAGTPASAADPGAADASGSWAYVAGSMYAGGQACGFDAGELQAFKARARDKVAAMGEGVDFDQAFEQGVTVAQQESGGVEPDASTCELTREAMQRG